MIIIIVTIGITLRANVELQAERICFESAQQLLRLEVCGDGQDSTRSGSFLFLSRETVAEAK